MSITEETHSCTCNHYLKALPMEDSLSGCVLDVHSCGTILSRSLALRREGFYPLHQKTLRGLYTFCQNRHKVATGMDWSTSISCLMVVPVGFGWRWSPSIIAGDVCTQKTSLWLMLLWTLHALECDNRHCTGCFPPEQMGTTLLLQRMH